MLVGQDALDIDRTAERGLGDADVDLAHEVVAVALETLVRLDLDGDDEVAGPRAAEPGLAVSAQAQLTTGPHARGDLYLEALMRAHAAVAMAMGAGFVDDRALALAIGTGS